MPRLNLTEATRNLADANIGQCIDCGTPWNDDELGPRCGRCADYFEDMDTAYFDSIARDEEYYRELEAAQDLDAEYEREAQFDDLHDDLDMFDDVTWDWDEPNPSIDPWAAMDYNPERVAA